jgi:hypothetical protein
MPAIRHTLFPQVNLASVWTDVTSDCYQPDGYSIMRGYSDEFVRRPLQLSWTFKSNDDKWRPTNAASPVYGQAGRNTPVALAISGTVRAVAEASAWRPNRTVDFIPGTPSRGRRWVELTAQGVLCRVGTWTDPLHSPMYRMIRGIANLRGYWPMEDLSSATQMSNAYQGGQPATASDVQYAADPGPVGSEPAVRFGPAATINGRWSGNISANNWQVSWASKMPSIPVSDVTFLSWTTSNGQTWDFVYAGAGGFRWIVTAGDGTVIFNNVIAPGTGVLHTDWLSFRVKVSTSGGTVSVEPSWHSPAANSVNYGAVYTYAGTAGALRTWSRVGSAASDGANLAHFFAVTGVTDNLLSTQKINAINGYVGETAADRFSRLCSEEGLPWQISGTTALTRPMGPQTAATFLALLDEVETTEDALIYDRPSPNLGLMMRTRTDRYNQPVALALTFPDHIAPTLQEQFDYVGIANIVTVQQRAGGFAVSSDDTGPVSSADPPVGVGPYKKTYDVNVASETVLQDLADWYRNRGTVPGSRYPQVTVDLNANPALLAAVAATDEGDVITITGLEPKVVRLQVIGIDDTGDNFARKVTFTCVPDRQFGTIGIYDDTGSRYDGRGATLTSALTTSATSVSITVQDVTVAWSTTSVPYVWDLAGEDVTVTAITAPTGTGPWTQTATVTRSSNGIVKVHAAGETVQLSDPVRYALR